MMRRQFLVEAISIGEIILNSAEENSHGLFWKIDELAMDETIYSGVSGIALFLIELAKQSKQKRFLEAAEKAMQWVLWYCNSHPSENYAFYTGRIGASFVLTKLSKATHKKSYLIAALNVSKDNTKFLQSADNKNDITNGISGTLLGLLHLHAATKATWIEKSINIYTRRLLQNAIISKTGIFWDQGFSQSHPLLGFSHGPAGIGFVLLELGFYYKSPAIYKIAEQAFTYENNLYDFKRENWPDFRMNLYDEKELEVYKNAYLANNKSIFNVAHNPCQWCHGAAGIGLSRLRAYELLKKKEYIHDIKRALTKTANSPHSLLSLCHGIAGNGELFVESSNILDKDSFIVAKRFGKVIIENKHFYPSDPGLFTGIAGIGYFFLRLLNSSQVPSILAPKVQYTSEAKDIPIPIFNDLKQLKRVLIANHFERTIEKVDQLAPGNIDKYLRTVKLHVLGRATFVIFITKILKRLPQQQRQELEDLLYLENQKALMLEIDSNNAFFYIKDLIETEQNQKIETKAEELFMKQKIQLSSSVKLVALSNSSKIYLLKRNVYGVVEQIISIFAATVLHVFTTKKTVYDAVQELLIYNKEFVNNPNITKKIIIAQIRKALHARILVVSM